MSYPANIQVFEGACGRSDRQSGKPYMANWQPITSLCLFVYPRRKFSHISTEKSSKLTGTNRFVTNNEKKGGFWLTTNKLVFWKIVLAQSCQTDTAIKHRGGNKSGGNVCTVFMNVWGGTDRCVYRRMGRLRITCVLLTVDDRSGVGITCCINITRTDKTIQRDESKQRSHVNCLKR